VDNFLLDNDPADVCAVLP